MSVVGQERRFRHPNPMSVLLPQATAIATCRAVGKGHVWTAPSWQGESYVAGLVGAAMCSAFECGSHDRWP